MHCDNSARIVVCVLLLFGVHIATPIAQGRVEKVGRWSKVHFVGVTRLQSQASGAPDGVELFFVVQRRGPDEDRLTLTELRDFTTPSGTYAKRTLRQLRREFEPVTDILEVSDALTKVPAAIAERVPRDAGPDALFLRTTIAGASLTEGEQLEFALKVGWDGRMETFDFDCVVPSKR
jgi:hypothetical protein